MRTVLLRVLPGLAGLVLVVHLGATSIRADRETLPLVYGSGASMVRISVPIADCFLLDSTSRVDATGAIFFNSQCKNGRGQVVFRMDADGTLSEVLSGVEGGRGSLDIRPDGWLWLTVSNSAQTEIVLYRVPGWVAAQRATSALPLPSSAARTSPAQRRPLDARQSPSRP